MAFVSYGRPYDDALLFGKGGEPLSFIVWVRGGRDSRAEDCAFDGALPAPGGEGQTIQAGGIAGSIRRTSKEGL